MLLAPLAAILVSLSIDEKQSWFWWAAAILLLILVLSLLISAICIFIGFTLSLMDATSSVGRTLLVFGAQLGVAFFGLGGTLFDEFGPDGLDS